MWLEPLQIFSIVYSAPFPRKFFSMIYGGLQTQPAIFLAVLFKSAPCGVRFFALAPEPKSGDGPAMNMMKLDFLFR